MFFIFLKVCFVLFIEYSWFTSTLAFDVAWKMWTVKHTKKRPIYSNLTYINQHVSWKNLGKGRFLPEIIKGRPGKHLSLAAWAKLSENKQSQPKKKIDFDLTYILMTYIHTYIYIYTYKYTNIHIHIHIHIYIYHTRIYIYISCNRGSHNSNYIQTIPTSNKSVLLKITIYKDIPVISSTCLMIRIRRWLLVAGGKNNPNSYPIQLQRWHPH